MMKGENKIGLRRFRVVRGLLDGFVRLRHFRGHGVHSPYVYNIVRKVFMRRTLIQTDDLALYDSLIGHVSSSLAIELQNLGAICCYKNYALNPSKISAELNFAIFTHITPQIEQRLEEAREYGATVVIIPKREERGEYAKLYDLIDRNHKSTLISRKIYLIIFNNHLPKQRFTL